jgi:hypothetical protein
MLKDQEDCGSGVYIIEDDNGDVGDKGGGCYRCQKFWTLDYFPQLLIIRISEYRFPD